VPGAIGIKSIARLVQAWSSTPRPTPEQLSTLRRLHSDLAPLMASIEAIPSQTEDPVLIQAADRVRDALREFRAEMADVVRRARRRSSS
jgi:hypothetical protein